MKNISDLEAEERKDYILDCAYRLFLENKIEAVSMGDIAKAAGIGRATIFRYFHSKTDLVIAVAAREWNKIFDKLDKDRPIESIEDIAAIDRLSFTMDIYIGLYKNNRNLLLFNDNFNHYLSHENICEEQKQIVKAIYDRPDERFHLMYEKAKEDGTFRTDIAEKDFFRITLHDMMAVCIHYSGGFVWGAEEDNDYCADLYRVKEMIINYVKG